MLLPTRRDKGHSPHRPQQLTRNQARNQATIPTEGTDTVTRTIRISEDNYRRLQEWAEPLAEKPDDVIGKILDVAERGRDERPGHEEKGEHAPQAELNGE